MAAEDRPAQKRRAAAEWAELRDRLRTVTPRGIGRTVLAAAVLGGTIWLAAATWPSLLPFVVGGLIAYQLLPVVDALDRVMPRLLAAIVAVVAAVAAIVAVLVLVIPPLAAAFVRLATDLPTSSDIDQAIANLQGRLGSLPDGSQAVVIPVITAIATAARDAFSGAAGSVDDLVRAGVGALLNAVGALLGLIVLPTWMLVLMNEQRRGRVAVNARITPSLRKDAWAAVAIVDRATGSYLRGYIVTAALVGFLAWLGLTLSARVGGPAFGNPLPLATFVGVTQVVPVIGPILALLPGALILTISPERAAAFVAIYVAARLIGASLLGSRLMSRRMSVPPAILVPGVVMIGQFGLLWLLLSAPIVAIAVDLVRYVSGRLSDPPRPAGVLPRDRASVAGSTAVVPARVPSAYRPATPPRSITRPGTQAPASPS